MSLVAFDVDSKRFGLRDESTEQRYEGRVAERAVPQVDHATANEVYDVVVTEYGRVDSTTGERKAEYVLEQLSSLSDASASSVRRTELLFPGLQKGRLISEVNGSESAPIAPGRSWSRGISPHMSPHGAPASWTLLVMALRRDHDPGLDPFREGVAVLRDLDGAVVGHLAAIVEHFWSPFSPLTWQECVWLLVTWTDGEGEPIIEDYPPWTAVDEVRMGQMEVERMSTGTSGTFSVEWLQGSERDAAWARCGTKEPAGYYLGGYHL